jgi:uncharacterized Zn-binding protein involved in type VI secretion
MKGLGRKGVDKAKGVCVHHCGKCRHHVEGVAATGSSTVKVNNCDALRVGDKGHHKKCCDKNEWTAATGSSSVFINGVAAFCIGDVTQHCGGVGHLEQGEGPDAAVTVLIGS